MTVGNAHSTETMMLRDGKSKAAERGRRAVLLTVAIMAASVGWFDGGVAAFAFQAAGEEPVMEEAAEEKPPKKAAKEEAADETAPAMDKSFLKWLIDASGPFGALIFVESFIMVALIIMCILQLRRQNFLPPEFIEEFEGKLNARDYQGAYESAKRDESLLARLMVAGMTKIQKGPEAVTKAMEELGADENMALEHRLSWLALIATTAPMLGLLGTVQGMVQAFEVIARTATQPKPSELAEGIMLALVTTLEGLIVAIPAMIAYSLLRNRAARFTFDIGILSDHLIERLQTRPAGGAAPAGAPATKDVTS